MTRRARVVASRTRESMCRGMAVGVLFGAAIAGLLLSLFPEPADSAPFDEE